jgi:hypothetical protein
MVTADVDHGIDRAGTAEHLAARLVTPAAIEAGLRHRLQRLEWRDLYRRDLSFRGG